MAESSQTRFFEVKLTTPIFGRWEWQVCENQVAIVCGYEATRETAQVKGDKALFSLLSLGS